MSEYMNKTKLYFKFYSRPRSRKASFDSTESSEGPTELLRTRTLEYVHLKYNLEAASLLPLALRYLYNDTYMYLFDNNDLHINNGQTYTYGG